MDITPTRRALLEAEGEKRFCTLMAMQWAEAMAASDGGPAFDRARDHYRAYASRLAEAEAEMLRLAEQDLAELTARPLFDDASAIELRLSSAAGRA